MQTGKSIVTLPLVLCLVLSVGLHAAALYCRGFRVPAKVEMERGKTVVQLTLIPSAPAQAAVAEPPPPEPDPPEKPEEQPPETPRPEPPPPAKPEPPARVEPMAEPVPEPVVEPPAQTEPPAPESPAPAPKTASANSAAQNSTLISDKGVVTEAATTVPVQPKYPRLSQRRNEEGDVQLAIEVSASGKPGKIRVVQSSGYKRLDEAAVKAVQKATFTPARKFGRPIDSTTTITITFRLTDD